jgi:hypothetical protein
MAERPWRAAVRPVVLLARLPLALMMTACPAATAAPAAVAATASSSPAITRITATGRHRPAGSSPSGNTHSMIAIRTSQSGKLVDSTTATEPSGSVPWCI